MLRSKEWQTPWLIDSTGQEVKSNLFQMAPRLLSQLLPQFQLSTKDPVEIFPRRRSMLRFKVWQTPWSTDLTGQDPRSHSFQTVLKFLASQLLHLSTKETEEIFPRKRSTLKFKVWPTPWSIDSTGQDPKNLSYQTVAKSLSQPLFINIKRDKWKKILPTRKLDQMSGLLFTS